MGDSSLTTWLSAVPLLITIVSAVAAVIAWRSGRRAVRTGVAILLIVVGSPSSCSPLVCSLLWQAVPLIVLLGVGLLIAEYRPGSAA